MKFNITVALALLFCHLLSSCTKRLEGSGTVITEDRAVGIFSGIENDGPFRIILQKRNAYTLRVEGEDNILPEIETRVINGILKVYYRKPNAPAKHDKITITVTTPLINQVLTKGGGEIFSDELWLANTGMLSISGPGEIRVNMSSVKLITNISGPGNIFLGGDTNDGEFTISGSGSLHAFNLFAIKVNGNISGSGKCELQVYDQLEGNISGSGSIYYKGNPEKVNVQIIGNGKVIKL